MPLCHYQLLCVRLRPGAPAPPAKRKKHGEMAALKKLQVDRETNGDAKGMGPRRARDCTSSGVCCFMCILRPFAASRWVQTGKRGPDRMPFWTAAPGPCRQSRAGSWHTQPLLVWKSGPAPRLALLGSCFQTKPFLRRSRGSLHNCSGCRFGARFSGPSALCVDILACLLGAGTPAPLPIIAGT